MKECIGCTERFPGCHDTCEIHQESKEEHDQKIKYLKKFTESFGYDGCLAPRVKKFKGYQRTRF